MSQQGDHSVFELGQAPWAAPTTDSSPAAASNVPGSANNGYPSRANGVPVPSGAVGRGGISSHVEAGLSETGYASGGAVPMTMSSGMTSQPMAGPSSDGPTSGTEGVLRTGHVGLAPAPSAIMLSSGITAGPLEAPPTGAKVLGGGFRADGDDSGVAAILATAAIDPGFHSEFVQGQGDAYEQGLGIENWKMCKKYFYLGCLGLPLVHFVNVAYFVRERRKGERNVVLQTYALSSFLVAMFWVIVSVVWFLVYQFVLLEKFKWLGIQNAKMPPELI